MKNDAALGAELDDKGRVADPSDGAKGLDGISRAASDVDLFFCAHDEVHVAEHFHKMLGHGLTADKARFAIALTRQAPEHGAVVQIDDTLGAMLGREAQGMQA